jgi:phage gpG-like protein
MLKQFGAEPMPNKSIMNFNLKGLDNLKKELKDQAGVKIGILGDTNSRDANGQTNAEIGVVHEFGSFSRNIPKRSFLREPFFEKRKEFLAKILEVTQRDLGKKNGVERILSTMAVLGVSIVQRAFATGGFGKWQPLSFKTTEKKKSASILIDTGQLRKSITYRIDNG